MRAHYFQHVPFEGLGCIDDWLRQENASVGCTRLYDTPAWPDLDAMDLLVVMGGPMSVNDEAEYPWLVDETAFIRAAVEAGKGVVGICLGAQLIASALGGRIYANAQKEIGWFPVKAVSPDLGQGVFPFPAETLAFHWHGETFDLPDGAVHLAQSAVCQNQAFQYGERVIGLQFHLETTPASARDIVSECRSELVPAPYIQTAEQILSADASYYTNVNALMIEIMRFVSR